MNASTFDRMAASYAAIVTEDDMLCAGCGDDPCNCRECERCGVNGHRDEMHRVGDDYLCEGCHDTWLDEQAAWTGDARINRRAS